MTAQRAKMEERFSDLKEEGRRVRETLLASDPKAAQAYNEVVRRPEYRALLDRRHQMPSNPNHGSSLAPDDGRVGHGKHRGGVENDKIEAAVQLCDEFGQPVAHQKL